MIRKSDWENIDKGVRQGLLKDPDLHDFLEPVFPTFELRETFIARCLRKISTRRMLLRAQWYIEIADDQEKVRQSRPALRLIFLMSLAEAIAKKKHGNTHLRPFDAITEFFKFISVKDKNKLTSTFTRCLLGPNHHSLRFSSILRILYDVRNRAVHGEDYFSFSLMNQKRKEEHTHYASFSLISSGYLGPSKRKRRVSLDIRLTYEELRDIFRRTAIANIEPLL